MRKRGTLLLALTAALVSVGSTTAQGATRVDQNVCAVKGTISTAADGRQSVSASLYRCVEQEQQAFGGVQVPSGLPNTAQTGRLSLSGRTNQCSGGWTGTVSLSDGFSSSLSGVGLDPTPAGLSVFAGGSTSYAVRVELGSVSPGVLCTAGSRPFEAIARVEVVRY